MQDGMIKHNNCAICGKPTQGKYIANGQVYHLQCIMKLPGIKKQRKKQNESKST